MNYLVIICWKDGDPEIFFCMDGDELAYVLNKDLYTGVSKSVYRLADGQEVLITGKDLRGKK